MRVSPVLAAGCAALLSLPSCATIKHSAVDAVSTAIAGYDKKGVPVARQTTPEAVLAVTGETDTTLAAGFFPAALKLHDMLRASNPAHIGFAESTGAYHVIYANAFIQADAETLPVSRYDEQRAEFARAKMHYLRGRDDILGALGRKYPRFREDIASGDAARIGRAAARLSADDVNAAYWAGAGWLGAFSLDPLDDSLLGTANGAVALLERAAALEPEYGNGAAWNVLCAFYAAAPADFGGNAARARFCYEESLRISKGKLPDPYVVYAQSLCVPANDSAGFAEALGKALAVSPDDMPDSRLSTVIMQKKAQWLLEHREDYFIDW